MLVTLFDPQPLGLPERVPSPFATPPHPLAARAALELRRDIGALGVDLDVPGAGKMFGVLVVAAPDGRIGYLRAFSGMLGGSWHVPGFAPPVFDEPARAAFWPAGEAELAGIDATLADLDEKILPLRGELGALDKRHVVELDELRAAHAANRSRRHAARQVLGPHPEVENASLSRFSDSASSATSAASALFFDERHALDQASRADAAERKRVMARHASERESLAARCQILADQIGELERSKAVRSRQLLVAIYETYAFANARDERQSLHALFAPTEPPGGAGDCAGPKLIALAYRERLRPIALAEIWCGAPPATGGRHDGQFYPACRGKCGPIMTHQLAGLACDEMPIFGLPRVANDEPRAVFEDEWLVVVDKPVGLLSVPGRSGLLRDSVQTRLRTRYPEASGPLLVHRLDLDTSGLLLAAKDQETYGALQQLFERRQIEKRYIAWLAGAIAGEHGTIELALRVDLDDRPRQIVDPVHGKAAITDWNVLDRAAGRTRVAFSPRTGRTHQLRVHAAHPLGLAAPIVGDRLYARDAHDEPRLLLHAEALSFVHPRTGLRLELARPAPF